MAAYFGIEKQESIMARKTTSNSRFLLRLGFASAFLFALCGFAPDCLAAKLRFRAITERVEFGPEGPLTVPFDHRVGDDIQFDFEIANTGFGAPTGDGFSIRRGAEQPGPAWVTLGGRRLGPAQYRVGLSQPAITGINGANSWLQLSTGYATNGPPLQPTNAIAGVADGYWTLSAIFRGDDELLSPSVDLASEQTWNNLLADRWMELTLISSQSVSVRTQINARIGKVSVIPEPGAIALSLLAVAMVFSSQHVGSR